MIVAVLAGLLAALVTAAALGRPRPTRCESSAIRRRNGRALAVRGTRRSTRACVDHAAFLDAVARRVRSGSSLTGAIVAEIDRCPQLQLVVERVHSGSALAGALAAVDTSEPDLALTLQALSAAARLGGPVAATIDEAASVVRERASTRAERRAHSAQARLSARVMTVVPLGFGAWNIVTSDTARAVYLNSGIGGACTAAGLLLNIAGWRWMKRIVGPP